jgi:hypothetical protein
VLLATSVSLHGASRGIQLNCISIGWVLGRHSSDAFAMPRVIVGVPTYNSDHENGKIPQARLKYESERRRGS